MSPSTTQVDPCFAAADAPPVPVTRDEVIAMVIADCKAAGVPCDATAAATFITDIEAAVAGCRESDEGIYYFQEYQLERSHHIMDVIMVDDAPAAAGSTHARLQQLVLAPNEVALTHTRLILHSVAFCAACLEVVAP